MDHLYRRSAIYWWRRRVPVRVKLGYLIVAKSLQTSDPAIARVRARAFSTAFDRVVTVLMEQPHLPTRDQLVGVLNDVFHRILQDGEAERAERVSGPPPWTPDPTTDPRYEGLAPEEWNSVPYPPEIWETEWRDALMMNQLDNVEHRVNDALKQQGLTLARDTPAWRRLCRLALVAAAKAHSITAKRESGHYNDGWPPSAGIPGSEVPGSRETPSSLHQVNLEAATRISQHEVGAATCPTISDLFSKYLSQRHDLRQDYRKQARVAIRIFESLMTDLPAIEISSQEVEEFINRLKRLPRWHGKSIYAGMTSLQAVEHAETIRRALRDSKADPITIGSVTFSRKELQKTCQELSMKTVNKYLTLFTGWGKWMVKVDERRNLLHDGKDPFSGKFFKKSAVKKEARLAGRNRAAFTTEQLSTMLASPLFSKPPASIVFNDPGRQLEQAKFWSILIGLYTGMRLGEIAMLRASDFRLDNGIYIIDLHSDDRRSFKTEAGDRKIPLHPDLIDLGLFSFAKIAATSTYARLLPGSSISDDGGQNGANISKWFLRWRTSIGLDSKQTPFHAFRKTFVTQLKSRFPGSDTLVDQIAGHEPKSVSAERYTDPLPIRVKAEAIAKIDYGINLRALKAALGTREPALDTTIGSHGSQ